MGGGDLILCEDVELSFSVSVSLFFITLSGWFYRFSCQLKTGIVVR